MQINNKSGRRKLEKVVKEYIKDLNEIDYNSGDVKELIKDAEDKFIKNLVNIQADIMSDDTLDQIDDIMEDIEKLFQEGSI